MRRALPLCALQVIVAGAAACPVAETVTREMAGAFTEDDGLLVAAMRYTTTDPDAPWFNDATARDYALTLVLDGEEVAELAEPWAYQGMLAHSPIFPSSRGGVVVGRVGAEVVLVDIDDGAVRTLDGGHAAIADALGLSLELSRDTPIVDAHPSPDGAAIAAFFTFAFEGPNGVFDLRFRHAIAFFDVDTGALRRVHAVAWPDDRQDPALSAPVDIPQRYRMLWTKDSASVLVLDRATALRFPIEGEPSVVDEVPEHAVPTASGPVASDGRYFLSPPDAPNAGLLVERQDEGWIPFDDLAMVPPSQASYALPPYSD